MVTAPTHRTVPVVPTDHMKIVGAGILRATTDSSREAAASWTYQMMLDAAPTPPSDLPQSLRDRVVEVLSRGIHETTHLSPREDDGSHWAKISAAWLEDARAILLELKERGDG